MSVQMPSEKLSILVVDDESLIAMLLEDMLLDLGCKVVGPAAGVASAMALIEANERRLDGAFLDVNLRGEAVYPVADELQRHCIPFVFVTGYAGQGIDPNYSRISSLPKPFLFAMISDAVGSFRNRRPSIQRTMGQPALDLNETP
jgi:CheY-like chemotaxis protein